MAVGGYRVRCPGLRREEREDPAIAEQGPLQQAVRRRGRRVLRERGGAARGQTVRAGGEHGAVDRSAPYLERWAAQRRKPALRQLGVDEIHLGKKEKFLTVASNLESGEPVWFGRERKKKPWTASLKKN